MKALDTPVLLALLEGDASAKELVRRLREKELATTALNLLELAILISRAPKRRRSHRRDALDRLSRKLTVLPIDGRAVAAAEGRALRAPLRGSPTLVAMACALEGAGCDELYTSDPADWGDATFKVSKFARRKSK